MAQDAECTAIPGIVTDRAATGPSLIAGSQPGLIRLPRTLVSHEMALVGLQDHPLTATAALIWNGDLPRPLQQILFDAADGNRPARPAAAADHPREGSSPPPQIRT